jgi:hypothetical protein
MTPHKLINHRATDKGPLTLVQIYTLVIGSRPFQYLGDVDVLVAQMIHFVEDLPVEWQPEWKRIKEQVGGKWNDIPGEHDLFN